MKIRAAVSLGVLVCATPMLLGIAGPIERHGLVAG